VIAVATPEPKPGVRYPGDTRPPFQPGHTLSLRHGVYSARTWKPLADAIAAELPEVAPWCSRATYGSAVAAWARVEAQLQLVMAWLDEHGPLDADGHVVAPLAESAARGPRGDRCRHRSPRWQLALRLGHRRPSAAPAQHGHGPAALPQAPRRLTRHRLPRAQEGVDTAGAGWSRVGPGGPTGRPPPASPEDTCRDVPPTRYRAAVRNYV
jgi:hypothetical protein